MASLDRFYEFFGNNEPSEEYQYNGILTENEDINGSITEKEITDNVENL
jgi:hypothetical protein